MNENENVSEDMDVDVSVNVGVNVGVNVDVNARAGVRVVSGAVLFECGFTLQSSCSSRKVQFRMSNRTNNTNE